MKSKMWDQTFEALADMASEYITKKRYALAIGLVVGGLCGWWWS